MKKYSLIVLLLLTTFASVRAQETGIPYDQFLSEAYHAEEPGAAVLVAKGNRVLFRKATGMADMENRVPLTADHVFEIGSITKQFTAVCILMLLEEGKLSMDDPITKFIERYPTHGHKITLHHLLTHTSGIKSYTTMERWTHQWRQDRLPIEMIDLFKNEPMDFAPGNQLKYNNSAYLILGYIIEKVSGLSYPEFLEKRIFTPLGLKNTYYGSMSKIIPGRAHPYQKPDSVLINAEYLSLTQPYSAGSIMSTVDDLYTWNTAVHAGKLVKKETLQKAFTDYPLNNGQFTHFGYGWQINEINGSRCYEHSGGIFGYACNGIYLPGEQVYVIVLSNRDDKDPDDASLKMAAYAIGKPIHDIHAKVDLENEYALSLTGVYTFDENITRTISYENGRFFSQRNESEKIEIFPQDKTHFRFKSGAVTLEFLPDKKSGKATQVLFKNRIEVSKGIRTARASQGQ